MASFYQRLGVAPSASTEEIRAAYRDLARRLHPDHHAHATPAERALAERRMREINEAWHTLRDPATRRRYDDGRHGARPTPPGSPVAARPAAAAPAAVADDDLVDVMGDLGPIQSHVVRGLPWIVLLVLFGAIFVFTAYATSGRGAQAPAGQAPATVASGSCLRIRSGTTPPSTAVVPCDGPHDGRLVARVTDGTPCPAGSEPRRLSTDGLLECLTP